MIKELRSIEEYKNLLKEFRTVCRRPFSNIYFMPEDLERYIDMGRASYEKEEYGIILFLDEDRYYRACLYVDEKQKFEIPARDKRILVRNIYRTRQKNDGLEAIRERLKILGFKQEGTSVQIQGNPNELLLNFKSIEKYAKEMEKRGYWCIIPDFSRFKEIEDMIIESGIIKDYHIIYRTEEEKKALTPGTYLCMVNNRYEICAASILNINLMEGICQDGIIVVQEKYKMKGFAPIMAYQRYKWLCNNNIQNIQGWILTHNEPSLKYHKSLGFRFIDKYSEEWLLDV